MPENTVTVNRRIISTLVRETSLPALLEHQILGTGFPNFITRGTQLCVKPNKKIVSFMWKFK